MKGQLYGRMSRSASRLTGQNVRGLSLHTLPIYGFDLRATHARTLLLAALASLSFGFVLVRVRVQHVRQTARRSSTRRIEWTCFREHPRHDPFWPLYRGISPLQGRYFQFRERVKSSLWRSWKAGFYNGMATPWSQNTFGVT